MNVMQNSSMPTDQLPGMDAVQRILEAPKEDPNVKTSAIAFLQALNRPKDPKINQLLSLAAKDKNPTVKEAYLNAVNGGAPGITA